MTEFNSPGGASNIKLSDYAARYPDANDGPMTTSIYVAWDGYRLTFNLVAPATDTGGYAIAGKLRIRFLLDSTVTRPVYIATTKNNSGADLCSSGVSNNSSAYNAASTYHSGSYTHIVVDLGTAAGGTAEDYSKKIYINTNIQQTAGGGGANVSTFYAAMPDSNRYVTYNRPYVDYAFNSALVSSGESQKLGGWTPYVNFLLGNEPGILKDGQNLIWSFTCEALPSVYAGGSVCYPYLNFFYPVTWTGTGLAQGFTPGSSGYLGWDTYGGSGTNYIGGSGAQSNTGTGVANVCRAGPANPTLLGGSLSGVSGFTGTWGGSGASIEYTLTNNTGNDYVITSGTNAGGYKSPFNFQYYNSANASSYTLNTSGWGDVQAHVQHYGQSYYPRFRSARKNNTDVGLPDLDIAFYCADGADRAEIITMIKDYINTAGGTGASRLYPGTQLGSATGTAWYFYDASEPTTGTLRIRYAAGVGGTFETGANPDVVEVNVTPGYQPFTYNVPPTASYSVGTYDLTDNAAVKQSHGNMTMSSYYGTRNLGTDGG